MKINAQPSPSLVMSPSDVAAADSDGSIHDAAWFSAALQPQSKSASTDNQPWINKLSSLSETAASQGSQADRALAKASRSTDPQSVMDANRSLSSYYLESLLNAKLIGKGVQSLEKLTNLQ